MAGPPWRGRRWGGTGEGVCYKAWKINLTPTTGFVCSAVQTQERALNKLSKSSAVTAAYSSDRVHLPSLPSGFSACTELRVCYWSSKVKTGLAVSTPQGRRCSRQSLNYLQLSRPSGHSFLITVIKPRGI